MAITTKKYHVYFYAPESHVEEIKNAMFSSGAGMFGEYSHCAWQTSGQGQYLPNQNADPFLGEKLNLCHEAELKVEMICLEACLKSVIDALKTAHPYEEPAYGVIELINF